MSVIFWNAERGHSLGEASEARFTPLADIAETAAGYVIELELPGFGASDVDVQIRDGVLSVAGERTAPHSHAPVAQIEHQDTVEQVEPAGDHDETRRVHRSERAFGRFDRRFRLPKDADAGAVSATAKDGVLTLEIARLAEAAPRNIEVKVA